MELRTPAAADLTPAAAIGGRSSWFCDAKGGGALCCRARASTMKKQVLFIQGGGAEAHDGWDNKLVDSLRRELGPGYDIRYSRMPNEADPSYTMWKAALAEEIAGPACRSRPHAAVC